MTGLSKDDHARTVKNKLEGSQKKDATPPTVTLESVLIISTIDRHERIDVAVVDIPVELFISDMDEYIIIVL